MNKIIYIDTSSNQEITLALKINGKTTEIKSPIDKQKAQVVLPLIDQLLKENSIKPEELTAIEVKTGPGSFTGLRVGIAVANALSYALGIPINKKKIGEYEIPTYE